MEDAPKAPEVERTKAGPAPLNLPVIMDRLEILTHEGNELDIALDMDDIEELEALFGEDDNDLLGNLASFAAMNGLDYEHFFEYLGVPIEENVVELTGETE